MNDKRILITGATNRIGWAAAEALAALGANLAIVGRSKSRTRVAAARISAASKTGATVATFVSDLSSQASVRRLAAEVLAQGMRERGYIEAQNLFIDVRWPQGTFEIQVVTQLLQL